MTETLFIWPAVVLLIVSEAPVADEYGTTVVALVIEYVVAGEPATVTVEQFNSDEPESGVEWCRWIGEEIGHGADRSRTSPQRVLRCAPTGWSWRSHAWRLSALGESHASSLPASVDRGVKRAP